MRIHYNEPSESPEHSAVVAFIDVESFNHEDAQAVRDWINEHAIHAKIWCSKRLTTFRITISRDDQLAFQMKFG